MAYGRGAFLLWAVAQKLRGFIPPFYQDFMLGILNGTIGESPIQIGAIPYGGGIRGGSISVTKGFSAPYVSGKLTQDSYGIKMG